MCMRELPRTDQQRPEQKLIGLLFFIINMKKEKKP